MWSFLILLVLIALYYPLVLFNDSLIFLSLSCFSTLLLITLLFFLSPSPPPRFVALSNYLSLTFSLTNSLKHHSELFDNPGRSSMYKYPSMTKTMSTVSDSGTKETFILHVEVRMYVTFSHFYLLAWLTFLHHITFVFFCLTIRNNWCHAVNHVSLFINPLT